MKRRQLNHIILLVFLALSSAALADGLEFKARLSGAQEVPEVMTDAAGRIEVKFNEALTRVRVRLRVRNAIGDLTRAHFHCALAGDNGPIALGLVDPGPFSFNGGGVVRGTLTNADFPATEPNCIDEIGRPVNNIASLALAMREGLIYANVHTSAFPGGEVRGQLLEENDDHDDDDDDDDDDD